MGDSKSQPVTDARKVVVFATPDIEATVGRPGVLDGEDRQLVFEKPRRFGDMARILRDDGPASLSVDDSTSLVVLSLHQEMFELEGKEPPDPAESEKQLAEILELLRTDGRSVVVFNVSTFDPTDRTHRFTPGQADPFAVRANRLIAALEHLAPAHEAGVVDVDGALAELGAADHVPSPGEFSEEAARFITEDAVLLIDETGTLSGSLQAAVMRLEVPPYDRRTVSGVLAKWHVEDGTEVSRGDPIFDISFDGLSYKVSLDASERSRKRAERRAQRRRENFGAVLVMQVLAGANGVLQRKLIDEGERVEVGDTAAVVTPSLEAVSLEIGPDAPSFRLGMTLKER